MNCDSEMDATVYWLDANLSIEAVAGPWDRFARENEGEVNCAARVLGRSLHDFIKGDEVRMWLETLLQLALATGQPVERPYRCDSPELQRFMTMRIVPEDAGKMRVEHRLVAMKKRQRPVYFTFAPTESMEAARLRCAVCGRIDQEGVWIEPDTADDVIQDRQQKTLKVVYTVCPLCRSH